MDTIVAIGCCNFLIFMIGMKNMQQIDDYSTFSPYLAFSHHSRPMMRPKCPDARADEILYYYSTSSLLGSMKEDTAGYLIIDDIDACKYY
jgi:hypothetical protein